MLANVCIKVNKLDEEIKQANQKIEGLKSIIDNLYNTNTIQQNQIYEMCHHIGIPIQLSNTHQSYIS